MIRTKATRLAPVLRMAVMMICGHQQVVAGALAPVAGASSTNVGHPNSGSQQPAAPQPRSTGGDVVSALKRHVLPAQPGLADTVRTARCRVAAVAGQQSSSSYPGM